MESFFINSLKAEVIRAGGDFAPQREGFILHVLSSDEWDSIPNLLFEHNVQQPAWLEFLRLRVDEVPKGQENEAGSDFRPRFEQLDQDVYFIRLRDLDRELDERSMRFFITPNVIILLGWNGFSAGRLNEWVERGILSKPIELACILALRVLRNHQKRLEGIEEQMDLIEEDILTATSSGQMQQIISLHRLLLGYKRSINATNNVIARLKSIQPLAHWDLDNQLIYEMEHLTNNALHAHEMIENLREAYQAAIDNRANAIMKVLTLLATIILPITLLTGFFGMNFENMPLIKTTYGIFVFYGLSASIVLAVLIYFKRKKWLE